MMDDDRERATGVSEQEWFEVRRFPHGVTMIREPYHDEDVKSYLIEGSRDVAVIDTGLGVGDFAGLVASLSSRRPRLLQSHAHWDHIGASHRFDDVSVHPSEADVLRGGWGAARYVAAFAPELVQRERLPADFDSSRGLPGCEPTGFLEDGDRIDERPGGVPGIAETGCRARARGRYGLRGAWGESVGAGRHHRDRQCVCRGVGGASRGREG